VVFDEQGFFVAESDGSVGQRCGGIAVVSSMFEHGVASNCRITGEYRSRQLPAANSNEGNKRAQGNSQ